MGPSIELCGGTHVRTTGQIGTFRFSGQSGVAAGVRRIEAVTGTGALRAVRELEQRLAQVADALKAQPEHLVRRVEQLLEERQRLEARLAEALKSGGGAIAGDEADVAGVHVTIADTASDDRAEVGQIADRFREGKRNAVLVLFSNAGRGAIHVTLTDDLVGAGRKAGDLVNRIAALSGGKGGGRPHFASAGAGDPAKLPAARAATPGWSRRGSARATAGDGAPGLAGPAHGSRPRRRSASGYGARPRHGPRGAASRRARAGGPPRARRVLAHPGDRSVALDLLAADALITLALLAQADRPPGELAAFATSLLQADRPGT